jgi:PTS system mannose-specific IID component
MKRSDIWAIFIRSLSIQASFNFWRMQNLGFVYALLPLFRRQRLDPRQMAAALDRHSQMFNTHPYLAAPIIGSIVKIEAEGAGAEAGPLKEALMGPYAGIGDAFFWGALRSLASAGTTILALSGFAWAPLAYLFLYNPSHFWVRTRGYWEGIRQGKNGIGFIRRLDLPGIAGRIRLLVLLLIGVLAAVAAENAFPPGLFRDEIAAKATALALLLLFFLGARAGISALTILYGTTLLCLVISI